MSEHASPLPCPPPPVDLRALSWAALLVGAGDFLLWPATPGLSLSLFALLAGAATVAKKPWRTWSPRLLGLGGLLAGSAAQCAVQTSFSNILVLLALLWALLAESLATGERPFWQHLVEGGLALLRAPLRWRQIARLRSHLPGRAPSASGVAAFLGVFLPTAVLVLIFSVLLSHGNPVLAEQFAGIFGEALELLLSFSPLRAGFWLLLGTGALALTMPYAPVVKESIWALPLPALRLPGAERTGLWRSWSILGALNLLFFSANTTDAAYLWVRRALPEGVNYAEYVHRGVGSLIVAVLCSAGVLVVLLFQGRGTTRSPLFRGLALGWMAQNLFLTASVFLRLQLYVEVYRLSTQRVYVGFFLLLVCAGFGLLAWRLLREKSLWWLVQANVLATFALFATVQFLPVEGRVAQANVSQWQQNPGHDLDVEYLLTLGAPAYPALLRAAATPHRAAAHTAALALEGRQEAERARLQTLDWRSRQERPDRLARALLAAKVRPGL